MTYVSGPRILRIMESKAIRTTIELPRELHRRIQEAAARKGYSARKLMLETLAAGVGPAAEVEAMPQRSGRRLSLDPQILPLSGRRIDLTNEEIYELIEFP